MMTSKHSNFKVAGIMLGGGGLNIVAWIPCLKKSLKNEMCDCSGFSKNCLTCTCDYFNL